MYTITISNKKITWKKQSYVRSSQRIVFPVILAVQNIRFPDN